MKPSASPSERSFFKGGVSALAVMLGALSGGTAVPVIASGVCIYNIAKGYKAKLMESYEDQEGDVFLVYFDLDTVEVIHQVRKMFPDNPINDLLGDITNTKIAHCALEICKDDTIHRIEMTSDNNGERLADKYGASILGIDSKNLTMDGFINLNYKAIMKGTKYDQCIERKKIGVTYKPMDKIVDQAKFLFKNTDAYDLFNNNCQYFAKNLAMGIV